MTAVVRMTDEWQRTLRTQFEEMAHRPLRCLGLASKDNGLGVIKPAGSGGLRKRAAAVLADTDKFIDLERGLTFEASSASRTPHVGPRCRPAPTQWIQRGLPAT